MLHERTDQILTAVDNLLAVHDAWEADETSPVQPTAAFEIAITEAIAVGDNGDVPAQCRDLCTSLKVLGLEWEMYVNGARTPDHRPIGSFWGAFRSMIHSRAGAVERGVKQPEPVSLLLEQKVPHQQIGRYIWGHQGKGPFMTALGQVDSAKIMEEAKEPGKYTKGWVHPEQVARQRASQDELSRRLGSAARREKSDEKFIEKATVVEMLKEGQYPDVIARVKGISLEGVLEEAKRYSIIPNVRPNLASMRAPQEHAIFGSEESGDDAATRETDDFGAETLKQEDEPPISDDELIRSLNDGKRGPTEIVAAAKDAGRTVTYKAVKEALRVVKTA